MKLSKMALAALIACGAYAGNLMAGQTDEIQLVSCASCDCGQPVCGCEPAECCDSGCDSCCDSGCGIGSCLDDLLGGGNCCLGDPYTLFGEYCGYSAGGWVQLGYHSAGIAPKFNNRPDEVQLQQAWLWAEKAIDTRCGFDIGGRIDYVYGTDGPDTQAFGINNNHWDNSWDNGGAYGHAIPQLYLEAGYGDLSVKAGHFYTIIGYEVVQATGNFFYSHAYQMYNSQPFTHTGFIATYNASDDVDVYGGYVMGWDSGFEDNGDAFLGGLTVDLNDDISLTYATVGGVFANNSFGGDERGYMHSIVANVQLRDDLTYVLMSDVLDSEDSAGLTVRDTVGAANYLIKTVNDCFSYGARLEWWNVSYDSQGFYGPVANPAALSAAAASLGDFDVYALTLGVNYRPHANVLVRPEIRFDWVDGNTALLNTAQTTILENNDDDQTTFGIDTIFTF